MRANRSFQIRANLPRKTVITKSFRELRCEHNQLFKRNKVRPRRGGMEKKKAITEKLPVAPSTASRLRPRFETVALPFSSNAFGPNNNADGRGL
jgi:hypothetical protein